MNNKEETFKVPIYNYFIKLVVTDNFIEYTKINEGDVMVQSPTAIVYDYYSKDEIVDFKMVCRIGLLTEDTIVHETFHLAARMLRYIGMPLIEESEEAYAYLQDFLFRVIKNKIGRMSKELMEQLNQEENVNTDSRKEVPETTTRN